LDALLNTSFIHVIDVPSLALIVPVLNRGLQERATLPKKKASQVISSPICDLIKEDLIAKNNLSNRLWEICARWQITKI